VRHEWLAGVEGVTQSDLREGGIGCSFEPKVQAEQTNEGGHVDDNAQAACG